jgi:hypothetical protein
VELCILHGLHRELYLGNSRVTRPINLLMGSSIIDHNVLVLMESRKIKQSPLQAWTGLEGSRRLGAPRFQDNRNMKVVRSAIRTGRLYSFLLEAESTPGPFCGRKD